MITWRTPSGFVKTSYYICIMIKFCDCDEYCIIIIIPIIFSCYTRGLTVGMSVAQNVTCNYPNLKAFGFCGGTVTHSGNFCLWMLSSCWWSETTNHVHFFKENVWNEQKNRSWRFKNGMSCCLHTIKYYEMSKCFNTDFLEMVYWKDVHCNQILNLKLCVTKNTILDITCI